MEERAILLDRYIKEWFEINNTVVEARPKDLMLYLIEKGIYTNDNRNGRPLRDDLRELDRQNLLHLIEYVDPQRKNINTYWYFRKK